MAECPRTLGYIRFYKPALIKDLKKSAQKKRFSKQILFLRRLSSRDRASSKPCLFIKVYKKKMPQKLRISREYTCEQK